MAYYELQLIETIETAQLLGRVEELKKQGYRLVQICCTLADSFEITYSFDKNYVFKNFRLNVPKENPVLPSITGLFLAAFTYENELHDLFGLQVNGLALDFKGTFYRTAIKNPFAAPKEQPGTV